MDVRVLICDDQEAFRSAAREVVSATYGFVVAGEVVTGEDSVVAVNRLHPDLVLMDLHLPGIDGLEACRRIRAVHPTVAVLLLSTYDAQDFTARIAGSGALGFISKMAFGPDRLAGAWASAAAAE